ncbi:MAG: hypothetical protein H7Z42_12355 [Roseiflexaceae bacterium]|nr:hypothetical protein [Roseiflexaceae bacterium]
MTTTDTGTLAEIRQAEERLRAAMLASNVAELDAPSMTGCCSLARTAASTARLTISTCIAQAKSGSRVLMSRTC